jgi:hypothetical protein
MRKPCKECPFKRTSAPGYLGQCNYDPVSFLNQPEELPCHLTVDYESKEPDFSKSKPCVGNIHFLNNRLKLSRDREFATTQKKYGKSQEVFSSVNEFIDHHS